MIAYWCSCGEYEPNLAKMHCKKYIYKCSDFLVSIVLLLKSCIIELSHLFDGQDSSFELQWSVISLYS